MCAVAVDGGGRAGARALLRVLGGRGGGGGGPSARRPRHLPPPQRAAEGQPDAAGRRASCTLHDARCSSSFERNSVMPSNSHRTELSMRHYNHYCSYSPPRPSPEAIEGSSRSLRAAHAARVAWAECVWSVCRYNQSVDELPYHHQPIPIISFSQLIIDFLYKTYILITFH